MALVKRSNQTNAIRSFHDQIDEMFNDFFRGSSFGGLTGSVPSLDVYSEDDKSLIVEAQVPGYAEKDINISLQNGVLEINGQRAEKDESDDKQRGYMIRESSSNFYRRVVLPEYVNEDGAQAELDKGVLKITVPFAERPEPKRIQIASKASKK